ncbi:MAG: hypothetical protein CM15mV42_1390 [uncultured marine virus]|nr:MAG: hypothetical protein CM15mV42_1390 [uncultured marine virus]
MGKHKYEYGKGGGKGKGAQALFDKLKSMGYKKAGGGVGDEIRQVMMKRGGMYKCGTPKLY